MPTTNPKLTTARLNEMLAVCEAATGGEWFTGDLLKHMVYSRLDGMQVARCENPENDPDENAAFIALARTALPEVIRELIATRENNASLNREMNDMLTDALEMDAEIKSLKAEIERLRGINPDIDVQELWQKELPYLFASWSSLYQQLKAAKVELGEVCQDFLLHLQDNPRHNGLYTHLVICSGNPRKPTGSDGCICQPRIKQLRHALTTANQAQEAAEAECERLRGFAHTANEDMTASRIKVESLTTALAAAEERLATMITDGDDEAARLRTAFGIVPDGRSLEAQLIAALAEKEAECGELRAELDSHLPHCSHGAAIGKSIGVKP